MEDKSIWKTRYDTRGQEENKNLDLQYSMPTRKQHLKEKDPESKEIQRTWF